MVHCLLSLFFCLFICLSNFLFVWLFICLIIYLSDFLFVYFSICLLFYLSTFLFVCFSICLIIYLSVFLFVWFPICLIFYLSDLLVFYLSIGSLLWTSGYFTLPKINLQKRTLPENSWLYKSFFPTKFKDGVCPRSLYLIYEVTYYTKHAKTSCSHRLSTTVLAYQIC